MTEPLVVVQGLGKSFLPRTGPIARLRGSQGPAVRAVNDVSFHIARGSTFALVGESGSGKSTIARMVTGLLAPSGGSVRIGNLPVTGSAASRRALRAHIQMVFQDPYSSLNPRWRVDAVIAEPIRALAPRSSRTQVWHRVAELLDLVGLHPKDALRYPHEFSGGQRQRIAIARALATGADFIVCDEPTSALDVSVQAQILNLMRDLQDRLGLTYLFISHNLAVVRYVADTIGVLSQGCLVESGEAAQIFNDPRHVYTRGLLAAVPSLEAPAA
jgi:peptide/nickel transport system ATP-binding protein